MNLHGSIRDIQNKITQLYLKLENRFSENGLIRDLWSAMAHDVSQQVQSLNALPQSFWNHLKEDPDLALVEATQSASDQSIENEEDQSLRSSFSNALSFEEPTTLKVYAPLIRRIRENSTAPALDFYIMVKAHLARITRVTQSFSGDPVIIQRANALMQAFEKEVQKPHIVAPQIDKKKKKGKAAHTANHKQPNKKLRKASAKARPMAKPAKILHRRSKPLVKKVSIARRRARP